MTTGGVLRNKGYSAGQLMVMFYLICVPLRLGAAYLVWLFGERTSVLFGLMLVAALGVVLNVRSLMRKGENVWWMREFHMLMAIGIAVGCGVSLYYGDDRSLFKNVIVGLMVMDVAVGVLVSIVKKPFL